MDLNSAPQFMIQIYKALASDPDMSRRDPGNDALRQLNVTVPELETNLGKADLIMSFVNQGKFLNRDW